jgi:hypothetical protein
MEWSYQESGKNKKFVQSFGIEILRDEIAW